MNELVPVGQPLDVMSLGEVLKRSGYFSDVREASQAVVKILAGQELGIGPIAAMTGIYIVKGRVTLSANLMAAQIKRSGRYTYIVRTMADNGCSIEFFENERSIGTSSFTEADAKAAGLLGGENWKKFPRNMYFARAISNGAKWFCPDVFSGPVYTPEEVNTSASYVDYSTGEIIDATASDEPRQQPELTPAQQNAVRKANEREAKARGDAARALEGSEKPPAPANGTPKPQSREDWATALRTAWNEEKAHGGEVPADEIAIDLDDPEEATIEKIKALGKLSKARLIELRKQQPV